MEQKNKPFGMRDKIGYAFGDFGCNMSFAFINNYLLARLREAGILKD